MKIQTQKKEKQIMAKKFSLDESSLQLDTIHSHNMDNSSRIHLKLCFEQYTHRFNLERSAEASDHTSRKNERHIITKLQHIVKGSGISFRASRDLLTNSASGFIVMHEETSILYLLIYYIGIGNPRVLTKNVTLTLNSYLMLRLMRTIIEYF